MFLTQDSQKNTTGRIEFQTVLLGETLFSRRENKVSSSENLFSSRETPVSYRETFVS